MKPEKLTVGVIGVQGDVSEHIAAISHLRSPDNGAIDAVSIRRTGIIPNCNFLIIPGGESTTISRLINRTGLAKEIILHTQLGKPLLATCAGLIVASKSANDKRVDTLGILDITVNRNAFGRQIDSFESHLPIKGMDTPFPAIFIRAPAIETTSKNVEILAKHKGHPVAVRQDNIVGTSFHPELTFDTRLHNLAFFGDPITI